MDHSDITLTVKPIANGFLVYACRTVDGYRSAYTPQTYVATREEIIAALPSLYAAAELLAADEVEVAF